MSIFKVETKDELPPVIQKQSVRWLRSKYSSAILVLISFAESIFLPVLIDPFLIALTLANPSKWRWYIFISITASVVGGIIAYILGALFFDTLGVKILAFYGLEESFARLAEGADQSGFVFVFLGAFTPIPYKLVALASGLLHINFMTFIIASTVGRILRLGLVGMAVHFAGPHMLPVIRKNLHAIAGVVGIILLLYIILQIFG